MKRLFTLLLGLVFFGANAFAASDDKPLFYHLQLGQQHGWLLGSIHVGDASFYPLPKQIQRALESSSALVLEADPSDPELPQLFSKYAIAKQPLPPELEGKLTLYCQQQRLHCNMQLAPWLLSSQIAIGMMANSGYLPQFGIETQLLIKMANKPLFELEGMAHQLQLFDSLSRTANLAMVEASLEPIELDELIEAWRQGDSDQLEQMLLQEFGDDELMQVLMVQRNHHMAERLLEILNKQSGLMVAIGAAHLIGDDSVVSLLRQQGVTVTDCWRKECATQ